MAAALLDTHILVWWRLEPARLSAAQARFLNAVSSANPAGISAITLWELAKLRERGRLKVRTPLDVWLREIETHPQLEVAPLSVSIVAESVSLGEEFPKDPADQIIVATARCLGVPLLTADERIRRSGRVEVV